MGKYKWICYSFKNQEIIKHQTHKGRKCKLLLYKFVNIISENNFLPNLLHFHNIYNSHWKEHKVYYNFKLYCSSNIPTHCLEYRKTASSLLPFITKCKLLLYKFVNIIPGNNFLPSLLHFDNVYNSNKK